MIELQAVRYPNHKLLPKTSGVYFVNNTEIVLYIGQSVNLQKRWGSHHLRQQLDERAESGETLNLVWFPAEPEIAVETEKALLQHLWPKKPSLNGVAYIEWAYGKAPIPENHPHLIEDCGLHLRQAFGPCLECETRKVLVRAKSSGLVGEMDKVWSERKEERFQNVPVPALNSAIDLRIIARMNP